MRADQAVAFLQALRAKQIRVKESGWVESSCPLAPWNHSNHHDHRPSFGLKIAPGSRSHFLCFACRQGSAEALLHTLELYAKGTGIYDFGTCHQILMDEEYVVPLPPFGETLAPEHVFSEWPAYWVENFTPATFSLEAMLYLQGRGVSMETAEDFNLRYDQKRSMIISPYWDVYGRLAGGRGRSVLSSSSLKHYDYTFQGVNNARFVWYNEPVLNLTGPVVVVEGQFDLFRTIQAYPKVVANLTAKPTAEKMKKLGDSGTVLQIPDRDEAGYQSVGYYSRHCQQLGLTHKVIWLDEGVKDAAECASEYLKEKIYQALNCT